LKYVGGTFEQKSEVGLGTSVRLVLPLNPPVESRKKDTEGVWP